MFRQQHQMKNAFGKSDIYLICRMAPLSYGISKCEDEIAKCEWMNLSELLTHTDTGPMTRLAARLAAQGLKNGFENVDILPNRMTSWVDPKKSVCIFHRYLPSWQKRTEDRTTNVTKVWILLFVYLSSPTAFQCDCKTGYMYFLWKVCNCERYFILLSDWEKIALKPSICFTQNMQYINLKSLP